MLFKNLKKDVNIENIAKVFCDRVYRAFSLDELLYDEVEKEDFQDVIEELLNEIFEDVESDMKIEVGDIFTGYCNGYFTAGKDHEYNKRCQVESVGENWLVVRHLDDNTPDFETIDLNNNDILHMINTWKE